MTAADRDALLELMVMGVIRGIPRAQSAVESAIAEIAALRELLSKEQNAAREEITRLRAELAQWKSGAMANAAANMNVHMHKGQP